MNPKNPTPKKTPPSPNLMKKPTIRVSRMSMLVNPIFNNKESGRLEIYVGVVIHVKVNPSGDTSISAGEFCLYWCTS